MEDAFALFYGRVDLDPACDEHDRCYGTCGSDKSACDEALAVAMVNACKKTYPAASGLEHGLYLNCKALASTFWGAVAEHGGKPYAAGQGEACECCRNKGDASAGDTAGANDGAGADADAGVVDAPPTDGGPDAPAAADAPPSGDTAGGSTRRDDTPAPQVPYQGTAVGDPHLRTMDGLRYDLQPVGELVLLNSTTDDFEIQVRTKPWGTRPDVAVIVGVAVRVGPSKFNVFLDGTARLDGEKLTGADSLRSLPGGVQLHSSAGYNVLVWPDGAQLRVHRYPTFMGVDVFLPAGRRGQVGGLLGNFDGQPMGDLVVREGAALSIPSSFSYFYGVFVESWRITQASSLFYYGDGETTETFTDRSFPRGHATAAALSAEARAAATASCMAAGVSPDWLDACIVDVGYTGDTTFTDTFSGAPGVRAAMEVMVDTMPGPGGEDGTGPVFGAGGGVRHGSLTGGAAADTYTFEGQAGGVVFIRVNDASDNEFAPAVVLKDANGVMLGRGSGATVAALDVNLPSTGTFSVVVSDGSGRSGITGSYDLTVVIAPGANEGGVLRPGASTAGTIDRGDVDSYTFTANAGEGVQLRLADAGSGTFTPALAVYGPTGARVDYQYGASVAASAFAAPAAGTYTVVVYDTSPGFASSANYRLYFDRGPGSNEGGLLAPGGVVTGTIDLGDVDSYTFTANAGEGVQLRVADVGGTLTPALVVYGPTGARVDYQYGASVAASAFAAPAAGTYTLVVYDTSPGFASSGDYRVYFDRGPGSNEGGLLAPGGVATGTIDLGDLDSYTFTANAGEGVQLRVADVGGALTPALVVYGPTGARVDYQYGASVAASAFAAPAAGTYTLVVYDSSPGFASSGDYRVYFDRGPGSNEGGLLGPGGVATGTIDLGDVDSYTFTANAGDGVQLRVADVGGALTPALVVYSPTGARVDYQYGASVAASAFAAPAAGTYTVVVYDTSPGFASSGDYRVYFDRAPGSNEGGVLTSSVAATGTIDLGDVDSYTFAASAGDTVQINVVDTLAGPFVPALVVYGPAGGRLDYQYGATMATSNFKAAVTGTHTLVIYDTSAGFASTGDYQVTVTVKAP